MDVIFNLVSKFWRYKLFPYALFIIIWIAANYISLPSGITLSLIDRNIIGIPVAFLFTLIIIWMQKVPITPKGRVGLIFAIRAETDLLRKKVSSDIVATTRESLKQTPSSYPIHVIELDDARSNKILDPTAAEQIRIKCRAHIVIYGEAKSRHDQGKEYYVLKLDGVITHAPIPLETSHALAAEMKDLLPLKEKIEHDNEISGFEITSLQMGESIKYVIATAALLTGDGLLAVGLLENIYNNRTQISKYRSIKSIKKLMRMTPLRLGDAYAFMSRVSYSKWESSRDLNDLREAISWIEKNRKISRESLEYLLLKAIEAFALNNNIQSSKHYISKCQAKYLSNPSWRYSAAFLSAIEGDIDKALDYYNSLQPLETSHILPFQVEGFIDWALSKEPTCNELNFCLGYLNDQLKGDTRSAIKYFNIYLNGKNRDPNNSKRSIKYSEDYVRKHMK